MTLIRTSAVADQFHFGSGGELGASVAAPTCFARPWAMCNATISQGCLPE